MGASFPIKLINTIVITFMMILSLAIPLFDAQMIFPQIFPPFLVNFKNWFAEELDDYLIVEKPYFFIGLAWGELLLNWPLSIVSLYGFAAGKSWFNIPCLTLGFSFFTIQCAIFGEMLGSGRASNKLLIFYSTFMAFAVSTIIRGLIPFTPKSQAAREAHAFKTK